MTLPAVLSLQVLLAGVPVVAAEPYDSPSVAGYVPGRFLPTVRPCYDDGLIAAQP